MHYIAKAPDRLVDEEEGEEAESQRRAAPPQTPTVSPQVSRIHQSIGTAGGDQPVDRDELIEEEGEQPEPQRRAAAPETSTVSPQVSRIHQSITAAGSDQPVNRDELMRGYEVAPDTFVTFQKEELRQLRPATSTTMEIIRSVRLEEIDPVFFDTSYYVVPDRTGERAYALLVAALRETGYVALATLSMHGRNHVVIVRPGQKGLTAHTMYYVDEVRAENEYPANTGEINPRELELAKTFVKAIAAPFAPEESKDEYHEQVRNLVAAKSSRNEVATAGPRLSVQPPAPTPVIDIMEALRKSLELRKPAASERKPAVSKHGPRKRRA